MTAQDDAAFTADLIAYLTDRGYKVTRARVARTKAAPSDAARVPVKRSGRKHGNCAEHYRIGGMAEPVCVLGPRTVEGERLQPQDPDEVLGFAEEIAAIAASSGDMLRTLALRDWNARHEQHRASAAAFRPGSMAGMSGAEIVAVKGERAGRYIGADDCAMCHREYRRVAA